MKALHRFALFGVGSLLAACSENSMAPHVPAADEPAAYEYGGGATADLSANDTLKFNITIDPSRQTYFDLGSGNSITFPTGSLCDPTRSTYGVGEWDKPCNVAKSPVTVKVTAWLDAKGHPRVDFNPNVRFVPSWDPRQWVRITFSDLQASLDLSFNILYCPTSQSSCRDEARTDFTLLTYRDPITHKLTRRIKHFSGYNVAAGDGDDSRGYSSLTTVQSRFVAVADAVRPAPPAVGSTSVADRSKTRVELVRATRTMLRDSGYILASG